MEREIVLPKAFLHWRFVAAFGNRPPKTNVGYMYKCSLRQRSFSLAANVIASGSIRHCRQSFMILPCCFSFSSSV
jgi:hypothetical protein